MWSWLGSEFTKSFFFFDISFDGIHLKLWETIPYISYIKSLPFLELDLHFCVRKHVFILGLWLDPKMVFFILEDNFENHFWFLQKEVLMIYIHQASILSTKTSILRLERGFSKWGLAKLRILTFYSNSNIRSTHNIIINTRDIHGNRL